jgi:hypothetical protein
MQVELSGMLMYERSSAGEAGDRHFRNLRMTDATMEVLFYASCVRGADLINLRHIQIAEAWATTDGRALGRPASKWSGPIRGVQQYNSGFPIEARGVTAKGRICVTATPSVLARNGPVEAIAPLHPVTVCGR